MVKKSKKPTNKSQVNLEEEKQQKSLDFYSPRETIKRLTSKLISKLPLRK
ncbi:MAG: hypothetical protein UT08_C0022G0007 [Candidatus Woesebacteria bacterium GW2011_GWB1_38_8]|uniref:Uncharacterized protein n=1 Tax=Candidatus Woesebacteria bacterium GW2011_GWB1_38_8 TaxID=1618570 RepID=A0A0G0L8K0_9BACT|nr:MAG: hypothetical protein UT08_C0022G0007 [Candidatus Woesebacteria bacterium GW2011_GWB1_38_8]